MYKKIDLDNGPRVILNHMPNMESAAIGVWIAAGSRNEKREISGLSHFLEHMIFKGTPTRSCRKIKEEVEGRGGSLNGFTSEEVTCYLAKVSGCHVNVALDVLSDMALHAKMDKKDIEIERPVIIEEIKMYRDLPNHHVHDVLNELMWPGHSLGFPVAGNVQSVKSITRQDIVGYKRTNYTPRNMTVVLSGNLNEAAAIKKISRIFRADPRKRPSRFIRFNNRQRVPQLKILYKDTEQSHLCMGLRTFGKMHKDRYALNLLHIILGANMLSRLFENVREKRGLAYEIGTEIKRYKDTGVFKINAGIENSKVREAVGVIINELKKIKTKGVSASELKMAKEFFKVQLSLAIEDTLNHMIWLGEHVLASGRLPDKEDIVKNIDAVSINSLKRVARDTFKNKNLNLALIGPLKDKDQEEIEKELNL